MSSSSAMLAAARMMCSRSRRCTLAHLSVDPPAFLRLERASEGGRLTDRGHLFSLVDERATDRFDRPVQEYEPAPPILAALGGLLLSSPAGTREHRLVEPPRDDSVVLEASRFGEAVRVHRPMIANSQQAALGYGFRP